MTESRRTKFLSPEQLDEALAQVAFIARQEKIRVALIGGFALQFYGSDRLTGDIDLAAEETLQGLPTGHELTFGGIQTRASNGVPVDFVVRNDDFAPLYTEAIAKAGRMKGVATLIVLPEYLVAMKMVAGRTRDLADLEFLLGSDSSDKHKARRVIKKHLGPYAAKEFDLILEEAKWKASRKK